MIKKHTLTIILSLFIYTSFAQQGEKLVSDKQFIKLQNLSVDFRLEAEKNRNEAFALAAKKNWVTFRVEKDGSIISLQGTDAFGFPLYLKTENNTVAAGTTRTNSFYTGGSLGLTLNGSSDNLIGKVGIWDGGSVLIDHQEFVGGRIEQKDSPKDGSLHSTHVAGTMMAAGVYPIARGMAWGLKKLFAWDFNSDIPEMTSAASLGMAISNHSYGFISGWNYNSKESRWEWYGVPGTSEDYKFGFYDDSARDWDIICYNAPYYLPVKSAGNNRSETGPNVGAEYFGFTSTTNTAFISKGPRPSNISSNDGYDIISTTGTAKNILTVGAINGIPFGTNSPSDITISSFSSWGPTDDGRIKPDLVADGVSLTSTSNESNKSYATLSGTSMSSPNTSGSLILLQEYYSKLNGGNFMRSATLKGLAIHTTDEAGTSLGPDYIYGWGLLNAERAGNLIKLKDTKSIITERTLAQSEVYNLTVTTSGYGPLKVTICWTDPEATITPNNPINNRTPKLINDLDLRITKNTDTFFPWKLDPNNPANSATQGDNIVDNVEQITIPNSVPGEVYTIKISHKGTLSKGPQAYSIIASGVGGVVYCASNALSTDDSRINQVKLNTINNTLPNTCRAYTNQTNISTALEAGKIYPIVVNVGTCTADKDKIVKIFFDWNGDGDFNDAGENPLTSAVINNTTDFIGNITVPSNVTPGNSSLMRIVLVETQNPADILPCGTYAKGETQDYSISFLKSTKDVGVISLNDFVENICATNSKQFSVKIKNFGSASITNVPVTLTLTNNSTVIKTITENYTGIIQPNNEVDFKLSGSFDVQQGKSYLINAKTVLPEDIIDNNATSKTFNVIVPQGLTNTFVGICDNAPTYYQLNAKGDGLTYWYDTANATLPIEIGNNIFTDKTPINNTFYAGLNDFRSYFGALNKKVYNGGNYSGNFGPKPIISVKAPMVLDSALLYISQSGQLTFTVESASGEIFSSTTIDVTRTKTTADVGTGNLIDDDVNDPGKVFKLGLEFPAAGTYYIGIQFKGATIFRSNVGVNNIPIVLGNGIISLTGASSANGTLTNAYYYFYNMLFKSLGCTNNLRVPVTLSKPTITQTGATLTASYGSGYKWFVSGNTETLSTMQDFQPSSSGVYRVEVISPSGCATSSVNFNYVLSAIKPSDPAKIGLKIYPIPSNGILNVSFDVLKRENINIRIKNILGQELLSVQKNDFTGRFNEQLNLGNLNNGTYVITLKIGQNIYTEKITLNK